MMKTRIQQAVLPVAILAGITMIFAVPLPRLGATQQDQRKQQDQQNLQPQIDKSQYVLKKTQTVKVAIKPMTVDQERDIGRELSAKLIAGLHIYKDEALRLYVNEVGATVAAKSERQDIQYHFAVLDSDEIKFLSAPGGYVFVTRGTIKLCEDESELAGVLAHEVGHISGKHVVHMLEDYKRQTAAIKESQANSPASAQLQSIADVMIRNLIFGLSPGSAPQHDLTTSIMVMLFDIGMPARYEYDADARGVRYAYEAGYPADGLERFLVQLEKATTTGGDETTITHTRLQVKGRNDRIQQLIAKQQWQDADRPRLADRYAALTAMLKPKSGP